MRIFNQNKTKELQLADIDLNKGRLVSDRLRTKDANGNAVTEHILVFQPMVDAKIDAEMRLLKALLKNTDYQAIKFAEGALSASEYATTKANRQIWRKRINELEALMKEGEV
jgi:hypothetical protein